MDHDNELLEVDHLPEWLASRVTTNRALNNTLPGASDFCVLVGQYNEETFESVKELASKHGLAVTRVDLSALVSKYPSETEKNLEKVLKRAATQAGVIFFDEADALFGKRTRVQDAHDRYATMNEQMIAKNLAVIDAIKIFAVSGRENVDSAFIRRIRALIDSPAR